MKLLLAAGFFSVLVGCATPARVMLSDGFVLDQPKVARTSYKVVGEVGPKDSKVALSNYYIQVCDVSGKTATNCHNSLILENVTNF